MASNTTSGQIIEGLMDTSSYRVTPSVIATAAATEVLTVTSNSYYIFTGSTAGQVAKLGDATTYQTGHTYVFHNNSTKPVTIDNNAGTDLVNLEPNQRATVILQDNTTVAGIWLFNVSVQDLNSLVSGVVSTSRFNDLDQTDFHQHHTFHFDGVAVSGGSAVNDDGAPTDNSYMGQVILNTGTTNNSVGAAILDGNSGVNNIKLSNMSCEWRVRVSALSTGVTGFQVRTGIMDTSTAGDPANGVFFYYSETDNSGKWRGVARNASTSTIVNSNISVVANQWYKLKFISSDNGNTVSFYVDGTLIGVSSTNTPITNSTRIMARIEKKAPNSAISRSLFVDWCSLGVTR